MVTGAFGLPRTCAGSAPLASPAGSGVGVAEFCCSRDERRSTKPATDATTSTITIIANGRNRFMAYPGRSSDRVIDRFVQIAVDINLNAIRSFRPIGRKLQMTMDLVLERVGRVIGGSNFFVTLVSGVHDLPDKADLGAFLGFVQINKAVHRVIGRIVRSSLGAGLSILVFRHVDTINIDVCISRSSWLRPGGLIIVRVLV